MPRLRLIDAGLPYKKIMQGSKWIGRVYKNADGAYTGTIGNGASRHEATAPTEQGAFNEVGARYFGQPSAAALLRDIGLALGGRRGGRVLAQRIGTPGDEQAVRVTVEPEGAGEDDFVPPVGRRH